MQSSGESDCGDGNDGGNYNEDDKDEDDKDEDGKDGDKNKVNNCGTSDNDKDNDDDDYEHDDDVNRNRLAKPWSFLLSWRKSHHRVSMKPLMGRCVLPL